ncbi:hypothetical protein LCGC14_2116790 [marine sediment metagenome]|uniref:Uncharacterized protein n=1 Tax=marine sediment metagenome TaxID=412755 RepID=A0A0F9H1T2_9ZZZZ
MTPEEFKERLEKAEKELIGKYPDKNGIGFFIGDMYELFEEWEKEHS